MRGNGDVLKERAGQLERLLHLRAISKERGELKERHRKGEEIVGGTTKTGDRGVAGTVTRAKREVRTVEPVDTRYENVIGYSRMV